MFKILTRLPYPFEVLREYGLIRGFMTTRGTPDESRSGFRYRLIPFFQFYTGSFQIELKNLKILETNLIKKIETLAVGQQCSSKTNVLIQHIPARKILKDYVNGKLLFCHPPPSWDPELSFNPITELQVARGRVSNCDFVADLVA